MSLAVQAAFGHAREKAKTPIAYPKGPAWHLSIKMYVNKEAEIRFYYIDSVGWIDNEDRKPGLYQRGCGLNLMGRYATLCTCKIEMLKAVRKIYSEPNKPPMYIGVLGDKKGRVPNSKITPVVFLGKVEKTFTSFTEIWRYLPERTRKAKDVRLHPLGDLYPPSLVRMFQKKRHISSSGFAKHYVHAKEAYKKDLNESCPIVFKEWQAWAKANKGFGKGTKRALQRRGG